MLDTQHPVGRQQDHALQAVPQLAHVAGPAIAHEDVHHVTRDLGRRRRTGDVAQQMVGKKRDVGCTLAQWRQCQPGDVEPMIEVGTEASGRYILGERPVAAMTRLAILRGAASPRRQTMPSSRTRSR